MNGILNGTVELKLVRNLEMMNATDYEKGVVEVLISNDKDFVPSLYERIEYDGTLEEKVAHLVNDKLTQGYHYILALSGDKVVGFTEVKEDFSPVYGELLKSLVVGTSAIMKEFQGKGIAKLLYSFLDNLAYVFQVDVVVRRTWSLNLRQLALYEKFGYSQIDCIENTRGEGVHSLIFCKWFKHAEVTQIALV